MDGSTGAAQRGAPAVDPFADALPGGVPSESQVELLRRSFNLNEIPSSTAALDGAPTVDPFADAEPGGVPSESQEELLRRSSFLKETPPSPSSSSFSGGRGDAALSIPVADRPILICSLPDSPPYPSIEDPRPATEKPQPTPGSNDLSTKSKKPSRRKKKSRGPGPPIISTPSPEETPEPSENPPSNRCQSIEVLKEALGCPNAALVPVSGCRVLPVSMRDPQPEEERSRGSGPASRGRENPPLVSGSVANPVDNSAFPANLLDALIMLAEKPDKESHDDIDILEIAKMKGIEFPPPKWWPPGGYGPDS